MNKFPIISPNARSHEFTKKHFGLYQDNSLEKAQRLKSLMSSNGRLFKKREKFLIEQINQRKLLKTQLATQHKLDEMVNQLMIQRKTRKDLEFNAAVRIQKHIRGFLARKECEKNITNLIRFHSNYCVNSMEKTILSLWIDLKYYGAAVKVIEMAYWRYKKRKILVGVIYLYKKYLFQKKAEKLSILEFLRVIICKDKVWELKKPAFIKKRLDQISENLSLIQISKFWSKNSLNPTKVATKIKKIKKIQEGKVLLRTASIAENKILSRHIWTYSLVNLPIVYNENILLGSYNPTPTPSKSPKMSIEISKVSFLPIRQRSNPKTLKTSKTSKKNKNKTTSSTSSRLPKIKSTNFKPPRLEKIVFRSPIAESLGFGCFNFKVWKPMSGIMRTRTSLTPNSLKNSSLVRIPRLEILNKTTTSLNKLN